MPEIRTEFLFTKALEVEVSVLGDTPNDSRRVGRFGAGRFEGPRIVLETDDRQQIYMTWKAFRHGPREVINRLNRGDTVDPETYYFRATPYFETGSRKYNWLNRICSITTGSRKASGRMFEVFLWPECRLLALRDVSLRRTDPVAEGSTADILRSAPAPRSDVNDPSAIGRRFWPGSAVDSPRTGVTHLIAFCHNDACPHSALIDVSKYPGDGCE